MAEGFFRDVLQKHTDSPNVKDVTRVGGGCINESFKVTSDTGTLFIKRNSASELDMFEKEAEGLRILHQNSTLKTPNVLGVGVTQNKSYLLLEWMEGGRKSDPFWEDFGIGLAKQHQVTQETFGLDHDNYIGRLSQSNTQLNNWHEFFITQRLEPQLKQARQQLLVDSTIQHDFQVLFSKLEHLIPHEKPSLLHGDLWSGNFLSSIKNKPVLIDPALHFGHRETELAFTTLFGGFHQLFYKSYQREFPLAPDFEARIALHNLYPLLVHVNLFGSSYLSGIVQTLKRYT